MVLIALTTYTFNFLGCRPATANSIGKKLNPKRIVCLSAITTEIHDILMMFRLRRRSRERFTEQIIIRDIPNWVLFHKYSRLLLEGVGRDHGFPYPETTLLSLIPLLSQSHLEMRDLLSPESLRFGQNTFAKVLITPFPIFPRLQASYPPPTITRLTNGYNYFFVVFIS